MKLIHPHRCNAIGLSLDSHVPVCALLLRLDGSRLCTMARSIWYDMTTPQA